MTKQLGSIILLLLFITAFCASAQEIQVLNEHPRLLLVGAENQQLKEKFQNHPVWRRVEVNATNVFNRDIEGFFDAACAGIFTEVTGDTVHVARVVAALKDFQNYGNENDWFYWGRSLRAMAIAYDLVHNYMSEAEQAECAQSLLVELDKAYALYHNWDLSALNNRGTQVTSGVILGCLAIWEYLPNQELFDWARIRLDEIIASQYLMGPNGGWYEGAGPYAEAVMTDSWMAMECLKKAANIDLISPNQELIRGTGNWIVQVHDAGHNLAGWDDCHLNKFDYRNWSILAYAARLAEDPVLQDWAVFYDEIFNETRSVTSGEIWRMLRFYDPALPTANRKSMPLAYTTGINPHGFGMGLVTGRSGWDENAVHFIFATKDYFGHHGHVDNAAFTISYGENLIAIDGGYSSGSMPGKDSKHHNTLLIPGSEPVGEYSFAGESGSQIYYHYPEPRDSTELFDLMEIYQLGELKFFYENNGIIYGCSDASNAYRNGIQFVRHMMLLQPNIVLIHDDVDRPNTFVMYAPNEADVQVSGNEFSYSGVKARCLGASEAVQLESQYIVPVLTEFPANRISFQSNGDHSVVFACGREIPNTQLFFNEMQAGGKWIVDGKIYAISADPDVPEMSHLGGIITDENNNPLAGVTVNLNGDETATATTDAEGKYGFDVAPGDYVITPELAGQIPSPRRHKVCGNYFEMNDLNFKMLTAVYRKVSGSLSNPAGEPLPGVEVQITGEETFLSATTDQNGAFTFEVIPGDYVVTPVEDIYEFTPKNAKINVAETDLTGLDFTGTLITYFSISGTVLENGTGLANVVVSFAGDVNLQATTDANGNYEIARIRENASGIITPALKGYFFEPKSVFVNKINVNITELDFTADTRFFGVVDFEDGTYNPFSLELNLQGFTNWVVGDFNGKDNNELMADPTAGGTRFKSSILTIPCVYEDIELQTLYRSSDCWEGPLALRVQDNSDSYFIWAGADRDLLEIVYEEAGTRTILVQRNLWEDGTEIDITTENWYELTLKAIGSQLYASVQLLDSQYQPVAGKFAEVTAEDTHLTEGYVGTRSAAGGRNLPYFLDNYSVINPNASGVEDKPVDEIVNLPQDFVLEQNYPNPFNPNTKITFTVPADCQGAVKLNIFNTNGQLVKALVNQKMSVGRHVVEWDGTDLNHQHVASGIYLYRITLGNKSAYRKMLLLK